MVELYKNNVKVWPFHVAAGKIAILPQDGMPQSMMSFDKHIGDVLRVLAFVQWLSLKLYCRSIYLLGFQVEVSCHGVHAPRGPKFTCPL